MLHVCVSLCVLLLTNLFLVLLFLLFHVVSAGLLLLLLPLHALFEVRLQHMHLHLQTVDLVARSSECERWLGGGGRRQHPHAAG
jgi:hypothetical protein